MPDRLAAIEDALSRGRAVRREELEWVLERLRLLERVVCDFAWSRIEACPACEAEEELAECLCETIGVSRLRMEERLLEAARERLPAAGRGKTGRGG